MLARWRSFEISKRLLRRKFCSTDDVSAHGLEKEKMKKDTNPRVFERFLHNDVSYDDEYCVTRAVSFDTAPQGLGEAKMPSTYRSNRFKSLVACI